jgi:hypothetical protein
VSSAKTRSRHPSSLAWGNYSSQPFGASSLLLLKAAGTLKYPSKSAPCLVCASSRTVLFPDAPATSGVGFVQPSSRSPRSPHLKSHSRQRRPTRLQVMVARGWWRRGVDALQLRSKTVHLVFCWGVRAGPSSLSKIAVIGRAVVNNLFNRRECPPFHFGGPMPPSLSSCFTIQHR